MAAPKLKSVEFRKERQSTWTELDRLVSRAEKSGLESLTARDLSRLPVVYRATLSSLSVARAVSLDRNLVEYLEALCARAYVQVYGVKRGFLATARTFLSRTFPRAFRDYRRHIGLSAAIVILGVLAGFFLTLSDIDRYYAFVPEAMAGGRTPAASTEALKGYLYDTEENPSGALFTFASFLFTHNSRVGMLAFALGFALGIPTLFLLFTNGLTLGAFVGLHHSRGLAVDVWGWLLPHGITELLAIIICGGAGLVLAQSIVFPGRRTRLESLSVQGREAAKLVIGAVFMLFLAGLIEGIFRQTVLSVPIRYAVAILSAVYWVVYFSALGHREEAA